MLFRLLILIIAGILISRAFKNWFGQGGGKQQRMASPPKDRIDDDMVQDPQCGIYFPRRQGVVLRHRGKELLFCSEECKKAYVEKQKHQD